MKSIPALSLKRLQQILDVTMMLILIQCTKNGLFPKLQSLMSCGLNSLFPLLTTSRTILQLPCHPVFCCTHCLGYQTLGEEYVNIIQVDPSKKKVPSFLQRALFISLHTVVPYCLEKALLHLEHELQMQAEESRTPENPPALGFLSRTFIRSWVRKQVGELTEQQKKAASQVVYVLRQSIPLLHRLHLAVFYIQGTFYHLSKRITGISYVSGFG